MKVKGGRKKIEGEKHEMAREQSRWGGEPRRKEKRKKMFGKNERSGEGTEEKSQK